MSFSSSFIILRHDLDNKKYIDDVNKAYQFSNWDKPNLFGKKVEKDDIPMYIQASKLEYANHFSKELFDRIMEFEFNSSFTVLVNEFGMSQYDKSCTKEINLNLAEEMLEAINYLLNEEYNRKFEDSVMQNYFIKLFGDTFAPYYNFYHKDKLAYDEDYDTQKIILKRLKIFFDMFVALSVEDKYENIEYVLLYRV